MGSEMCIRDSPDATPEVAALARLCAFSDLFLSAPVQHRREFRLQQQLLVTPGLEDAADAGNVVKRYASTTKPEKITADIEAQLKG